MNKTIKQTGRWLGAAALLLAVITLGGCDSADVQQMQAGLVKTGMSAEQAKCFAESMSKSVDAGPYNYMAKLMNAGEDEKSAVNRARRKYGAEFKTGVEKSREACIDE